MPRSGNRPLPGADLRGAVGVGHDAGQSGRQRRGRAPTAAPSAGAEVKAESAVEGGHNAMHLDRPDPRAVGPAARTGIDAPGMQREPHEPLIEAQHGDPRLLREPRRVASAKRDDGREGSTGLAGQVHDRIVRRPVRRPAGGVGRAGGGRTG